MCDFFRASVMFLLGYFGVYLEFVTVKVSLGFWVSLGCLYFLLTFFLWSLERRIRLSLFY